MTENYKTIRVSSEAYVFLERWAKVEKQSIQWCVDKTIEEIKLGKIEQLLKTPALNTYQKARDRAYEAHQKTKDRALEIHKKAIAPILKIYERSIAQAEKAYRKADALALKTYWKAYEFERDQQKKERI